MPTKSLPTQTPGKNRIVSGAPGKSKYLADKILEVLKRFQIPPFLLEFEITERSIVANSEVPLLVCEELAAAGMTLSVDDFGTDYSALSHIANFPIGNIKIDRSFIDQMLSEGKIREIKNCSVSLKLVNHFQA